MDFEDYRPGCPWRSDDKCCGTDFPCTEHTCAPFYFVDMTDYFKSLNEPVEEI